MEGEGRWNTPDAEGPEESESDELGESAQETFRPRAAQSDASDIWYRRAVQDQLPVRGTLRVPAVDDTAETGEVAKNASSGDNDAGDASDSSNVGENSETFGGSGDATGAASSSQGTVSRPLGKVNSMPTDLLGRRYETFPAPQPLHQHGPARVLAMCNQKGGVGKTTSSINIGGALSQYGRRVLIVDFDPQGAATVGLGINANTVDNTIYTALFDASIDPHEIVQHTDFENLDIMPANIDLSAAEVQLVTEVGREQILAGVLRQIRDEYDAIIIDCQPSLGLLTVNALTAADGVIIPVAAEFFALRGVALLMQSIDKVRSRINPSLEVYGVLMTMYTRTLHCEEVLQRIYEAFQEKVFHSVISRSIKLPDANVAAAPITIYAPGHKTAKEYREVARELIARGIVA
jgi:chromosome partitioning protein